MNIQSKLSGHWTDDQLISHLYGVGPEDNHIDKCPDCQARLSEMEGNRAILERSDAVQDVDFDFLAAQRRRIYARLTAPVAWWSHFEMKRWLSATAALLVAGGGLFLYQQNRGPELIDNKVSDVQLAQEVSRMIQDSEPQPTAPLQGLFDE